MYHTKVYNPVVASSSDDYSPRDLLGDPFSDANTRSAMKPTFEPQSKTQWKSQSRHVFMSSASRDISVFPNPASFSVVLDEELKNVTAMRVVQGTIPNIATVNTLPFIILDIPDLNNISMSGAGSSAASILQMDATGITGFLKFVNGANSSSSLKNRKDKLSRFDVTLRSPDGSVIDLGTDTTSPVDPTIQWSCVIEFTCDVPVMAGSVSSHSIPFM